MEVAVIDWKSIDSRFVKDDLYEHINAPKWVDFSAPDDPVDDQAWFCRPNCDHPKTAEDFLNQKERTLNSNFKHQRSASVSDIPPFGDRNKRDTTLKKRGTNQPSTISNKDSTNYHRINEGGENQDPNFSTPPIHKAKAFGKEAFKSSTEKKPIKEQTPKLRSTLSARNLFSGGDLLNKVAEFCNELKKLATRPRDKENGVDFEKEVKFYKDEILGVSNVKEKERTPLLEVSKEKSVAVETSGGSKGQLRRKKRNGDDAENTPISIDLKNMNKQETTSLSQIRTCPPTPQCFSATRATPKATTPKPFKQRPMNQERGILQELKPKNKEVFTKEEKTINNGRQEIAEKEARSLDVFWFLKPCTLSS